jgi:uncharacterized protein YukE
VLRQKFNGEAFYNQEIAKLEQDVARLTQQVDELATALRNRGKVLTGVEEELREVKA